MELGRSFGDNAITHGYNAVSSGYNQARAGLNVDGFAAGGMSSGYGQLQNRDGAHANFASESAAWEGRRDFANQTSGYLSALGVDSSVVGPGNKPSDMMGMAMSGMLGSEAKASANYFSEGGAFFGAVSGQAGSINSAYGSSAVGGAYYQGSWAEGLNGAWGQMMVPKDALARYAGDRLTSAVQSYKSYTDSTPVAADAESFVVPTPQGRE
jgi:hypothetical protein